MFSARIKLSPVIRFILTTDALKGIITYVQADNCGLVCLLYSLSMFKILRQASLVSNRFFLSVIFKLFHSFLHFLCFSLPDYS